MLSAVLNSNSVDYALFVFGALIAIVVLAPVAKHDIIFNFWDSFFKHKQQSCHNSSVKVGDCATISFEKGFNGLYGLNNNAGKCGTITGKIQNGLHNSLLPFNSGVVILQKNYDQNDNDLIVSIEVQFKNVNEALNWVDELKRTCCDNGALPVIKRYNK